MTGPFVSLNYACEESIVDYLISVCDPLETTASYYTGIGNVEDLQAPAVVVSCDSGYETVYLSNVYDLNVNISIKEMAADSVTGSLGTGSLGRLTANIYNAVCNSSLKYMLNNNNQRNFSTYFVQKTNSNHSIREDALISEIGLRLVGSLSGSL